MAGNTSRCFGLAGVAVLSACASVPSATIRHAMGETRISGSPSRVVALTNESTEALLALGIVPVGAVRSWTQGATWYRHLPPAMEKVRVVGDEDHVDLVAVAGLEPDLILGNKLRQGPRYAETAAIAPTVFSETLRGEWKRNLALYADAVGRSAGGRAVLADWQRRLAAARGALRGPDRTRVAVLRFMPDRTRIYHEESFSGVVLRDLGFARAGYHRGHPSFEDLPRERLADIAADVVFYFIYDDGSGAAAERERAWTADPSWRSLAAVRSRQAFRVDDATWNTAGGILAARRMLGDIVRCLGTARESRRSGEEQWAAW